MFHPLGSTHYNQCKSGINLFLPPRPKRPMTTPWTNAYFIGRAIAEILTEKANDTAAEVLSELGRLDAERREVTREFLQEVSDRATVAQQQSGVYPSGVSSPAPTSNDLQAIIDDLRAEIAETRAELQRYRQVSGQ